MAETPVVIPEEDVPMAETPVVEIPEENVPLAEAPETPDASTDISTVTVSIPDTSVPLASTPASVTIPDEAVPMADVPKTGDMSAIWSITACVSAAALLALALMGRKRYGEG